MTFGKKFQHSRTRASISFQLGIFVLLCLEFKWLNLTQRKPNFYCRYTLTLIFYYSICHQRFDSNIIFYRFCGIWEMFFESKKQSKIQGPTMDVVFHLTVVTLLFIAERTKLFPKSYSPAIGFEIGNFIFETYFTEEQSIRYHDGSHCCCTDFH